jgi:hypothetical protein
VTSVSHLVVSVVVVGSRIGGHRMEAPDIGRWWCDDVAKPIGPELQCLALLGSISVSVVNPVDTLLLMTKDQLGERARPQAMPDWCARFFADWKRQLTIQAAQAAAWASMVSLNLPNP